jgi:nicotinamidase-related amidase
MSGESHPDQGWLFMFKNILFVIDVQNYFFRPDSKAYISESKIILKKINRAVEFFNLNGGCVLYTRFINPKEANSRMASWWRHMPDKEGSLLFSGLEISENAFVYEKTSYSVFKNENILETVKNIAPDRIFFTGVMTHLCVESSVRDAFELNYNPIVISDCCASSKKDFHLSALNIMKHGFAKIVEWKDATEEYF